MTELVDKTFERILDKGFDPHSAPFPYKVVVMLTTAQGIIDNGGFEYFFESPFDGTPDMDDFPRVYEAVGALGSADTVREALRRNLRGDSDFEDLNNRMWATSEDSFDLLDQYICNNEQEFV